MTDDDRVPGSWTERIRLPTQNRRQHARVSAGCCASQVPRTSHPAGWRSLQGGSLPARPVVPRASSRGQTSLLPPRSATRPRVLRLPDGGMTDQWTAEKWRQPLHPHIARSGVASGSAAAKVRRAFFETSACPGFGIRRPAPLHVRPARSQWKPYEIHESKPEGAPGCPQRKRSRRPIRP